PPVGRDQGVRGDCEGGGHSREVRYREAVAIRPSAQPLWGWTAV
ncbi:hypothetical protein AK812_SmicGene48823, partial [Symbiodinium microadriaticum]